MTRLIFWLATAVVAYTYVGFPLLVTLRAAVRPRPHRKEDITPSVSVIIAAHDEAAAIGARIDNLMRLDYPRELLQVVVASDGSTDGTVSIARSRGDDRVLVLDLARVGKAAALTRAVDVSSGDVLVFSDANTAYAPDAIRTLVRSFADPEVGGVAGNQVYLAARLDGSGDPMAATSAGFGERSYWDFDRIVKEAESLGGNVISATGAIYAIRRELFRPVPDGVTDDFVTSTSVIAQHRRLVFEPEAVALEPVAGSSGREYRRKVRIMTRGLRGVATARALLDPRQFGFYSLQLLTHKLLRRLMVVPLLVVASASLASWRHGWVYRLATAGQVAIYGLGAAGLVLHDRPAGRRPWFAIPSFFLLVNVASLHAMYNLLTGERIDRWVPARRSDLATGGRATDERPDVLH